MTIAITAARHLRDGLYAQVRLGDEATDCMLVARAATGEGDELPVRALQGANEGDWTVALPALSVTQVLSLSAVSWDDGTVVEELTHRLHPLAARLASPVDAVRRKGAGMRVRVADWAGLLGGWDVSVDRLVSTRDGWDVCQGHAVLRDAGRQAVEGDVSVRVLDASGRDASGTPWVCLSDEVRQLAAHPGFFERRVEFSLRVPSAATTLVAWVRPELEALPMGFASLGPRTTSGLRAVWKDHATSAFASDDYDAWFSATHAATSAELAMQQDGSFDHGVSFSIVSVLRDASFERLRAMVDSVLAQSYGHLELVLVNAAPDNRRLASAVRGLELADARVRSVPLAADFGSAAATSEGVDAATGDFVCLLGEGDLLAPDALWHLSSAMADEPRADVLYTDEDRIERGRHVRPCFKPDWDPDLLLGTNYIGGLLAMRSSLLRDLGTMDRALDGAEAHSLALYATQRARCVCHVPRVLYHACGNPAAPAGGASSVAPELVALGAHLDHAGLDATVRASVRAAGGLEVSYALGDDPPLVSVIIISRDDAPSLERCLASVRDHTAYENYEVIVVEHGSVKTETFEFYRRAEAEDPRVRTIYFQGDADADLARLVGFGVSRARGSLLLLLSPRAEVTEGSWMGRMASLCSRQGTGAVGVRLVRPDGTISSSGLSLSPQGPVELDRYLPPSEVVEPQATLLHGVTAASGACLMVDAEAYREVGGMPEALPGHHACTDLCLRLRKRGQRVVLDPKVSVVHHRPLVADERPRVTAGEMRAIGRLWEDWPYGSGATDPTVGPNVDPRSPYRTLRA